MRLDSRTRGAAVTTEEEHVESKPTRRGARSRRSSADVAARRHQGRMLALQVLYEVDLTNHDPEEAMARAFAEHEPVTPEVVEHVRSLVRGVGRHRDELDPVIAGAAPARELAERFGGENSGRFINGVLRTILEEHPRADGRPVANQEA